MVVCLDFHVTGFARSRVDCPVSHSTPRRQILFYCQNWIDTKIKEAEVVHVNGLTDFVARLYCFRCFRCSAACVVGLLAVSTDTLHRNVSSFAFPLVKCDSVLQVCQLTELQQTKVWERYQNRFRCLYETLLPENWESIAENGQQAKQSQRSS